MTLNVGSSSEPTTPRAGLRAAVNDDLIDELSGWGPEERLRTFVRWHQGSLSLVQLMVVTVLEGQGPVPMTRLAETLGVSDASVTGIVDRMERRGLVGRRRDAADRRVVLVALTDEGEEIFREHRARRRERVTRVVDHLTDPEAAGLLAGLRALRNAIVRVHGALPDGEAGDVAADRPTGDAPAGLAPHASPDDATPAPVAGETGA